MVNNLQAFATNLQVCQM